MKVSTVYLLLLYSMKSVSFIPQNHKRRFESGILCALQDFGGDFCYHIEVAFACYVQGYLCLESPYPVLDCVMYLDVMSEYLIYFHFCFALMVHFMLRVSHIYNGPMCS